MFENLAMKNYWLVWVGGMSILSHVVPTTTHEKMRQKNYTHLETTYPVWLIWMTFCHSLAG